MLHIPVMLEQIIRLLRPRPGQVIVDATLGAGGHAGRILEELGPDGQLIGLDRDAEVLEHAGIRLKPHSDSATLVHARLSFLAEVVRGSGRKQVDGVLMDLGVSSFQLDELERGFSFRTGDAPAPLDMRMDRRSGATAAQLLERWDEPELVDVLRAGGVPAPTRIARALRSAQPLTTTSDLLGALKDVRLPRRRHHPATLVFQALRMAVNEELAELEAGLEAALDLLAPGGRLAVLSYHSGEDRLVKGFFAREAKGCICPPDLPVCGCGRSSRVKIVARGEQASETEVSANPRARSARLRGGERT